MLSRSRHFILVAIEISGAFGPDALSLICSMILAGVSRQSHVITSPYHACFTEYSIKAICLYIMN